MAGSRHDAKQPEVTEAPLVAKLIRFPADWVARVDEVRGEQSFSDFVRLAVLSQIDNGGLSDSPQWGQGRPRIITVEDQLIRSIELGRIAVCGQQVHEDVRASGNDLVCDLDVLRCDTSAQTQRRVVAHKFFCGVRPEIRTAA